MVTAPGPGSADDVAYAWRERVDDTELAALVASDGGEPVPGWWDRVRPHSLGWVSARDADDLLVGFVNVAWDGGEHAFLLDTRTRRDRRRGGIGTALVRRAVEKARAAGCAWIEVDFEPHLRGFYLDACGFRPTEAGLVRLRP